jgi:small subunit ribosomal protein S16
MAAKIRLARVGGHKNPYYRIVVADESSARDGRFLEILGTYHPVHKGKEVEVKLDQARVDKWLKVGAMPSETVAQIFERQKKAAKA